MFVAGIVVDGKLVTTDLRHQPQYRSCWAALLDEWKNQQTFVKTDPLKSGGRNHPEPDHNPRRRSATGASTWVMSPRWFDKRTGDHLAMDREAVDRPPVGHGAGGLVDIGYIKAAGTREDDAC
jgi:hydrogenase large subunit